jgi:uncharacterized protein DUF2442/uncharacterized protein DUF4160
MSKAGDATAKYWLEPVELARSRGFRATELTRLRATIIEHRHEFLEAWHAHFANPLNVQALSVEFVDASIRVILDDGREISAPLAWFPRLRDASDAQRGNWRLIGHGEASIGQTSMRTCRSTHC